MKSLIRYYLIETVALYVVSNTISGMVFQRGTLSLLEAGLGLTIVSLSAKPIINILLLPINLVTFGLFRWVSAAFALYLVTLLVNDFKIISFSFPGTIVLGFSIPALNFGGLFSIIAFSFVISFITSFFHWLLK